MTPKERKEFVVDVLSTTLMSSFVTEDVSEGDSIEDGIRAFFDEHEERWEPFESWANEERPFSELENLLTSELALDVHAYCREEMGYDWLTDKRQFAYDYSV